MLSVIVYCLLSDTLSLYHLQAKLQNITVFFLFIFVFVSKILLLLGFQLKNIPKNLALIFNRWHRYCHLNKAIVFAKIKYPSFIHKYLQILPDICKGAKRALKNLCMFVL